MNCNVDFKIINDRGELELGLGTGVNSEVYTLFWNEFSISMTIRIGRGFLLLGMTIFIDPFSTYLSPLEEELILDVMIKNELPDDELR